MPLWPALALLREFFQFHYNFLGTIPTKMATQVQRQADAGDLEKKANQLVSAYFATAMLGLLVLFTGAHMVSVVLQNRKATSHGSSMKHIVLIIRCNSLLSYL
jgi:hypothetical protein